MARPLARRLALFAALAATTTALASGQARPPESAIPDLVSGLVYVSLSQEISAANYAVSNDSPYADDTTFQTLKVPWERDFDVSSEYGTLYVEAALGWLSGEDRSTFPLAQGPATVSQDWNVYGGLAGVGWTFPLAEGWRLRPSVSLALSRIENDASYNELGQQVLAPLLDGVYVNWQAWAASTLLSLSLLHERELGKVQARLRGRMSWAYSDVFSATSAAQESADWTEFVALRADLGGPTRMSVDGRPVRWGAFVGYAGFHDIETDSLGFSSLYDTGLSVAVPTSGSLPDVQLSGALIFGPQVSGWSLGLGVSL